MIPVEKYDEFCALMPIVCVNAIIFDGDKVLLVRRATPLFKESSGCPEAGYSKASMWRRR